MASLSGAVPGPSMREKAWRSAPHPPATRATEPTVARGADVDKPRNLAKSVTVE